MAGDLIDSTEMYLRTVLELEEEGIPPIRARLAERLGLSAPSVSEGVSRLESEGLVELGEDRTISLTSEGRALGTRVLRKHRLVERLLVDVLDVEHEHVHEEACRWEHVISDRVEEKLASFLGHPTTSPYGNPIPGAEETDYEPLTLADAGEGEVRVERISEQLQGDHDVMHQLDEAGIQAGETIEVSRDGDAVTAKGRGEATLALDDAKLVYVSKTG
ncbi:MAG: metal-dependent transcriptional regulator [Nitriliruptorales bacterium]|nr:metal-dependent transcriptional regulator [Nitriliruptorales bacterium]